MSDDFHSKVSELVSQLNDLVQGASETKTDPHSEMPPGADEGDPGTDDFAEPEGDSKPFAEGAHDKHVGTDASFSADKGSPDFSSDDEDKSGKKAMLLSLLKKHGG